MTQFSASSTLSVLEHQLFVRHTAFVIGISLFKHILCEGGIDIRHKPAKSYSLRDLGLSMTAFAEILYPQ